MCPTFVGVVRNLHNQTMNKSLCEKCANCRYKTDGSAGLCYCNQTCGAGTLPLRHYGSSSGNTTYTCRSCDFKSSSNDDYEYTDFPEDCERTCPGTRYLATSKSFGSRCLQCPRTKTTFTYDRGGVAITAEQCNKCNNCTWTGSACSCTAIDT